MTSNLRLVVKIAYEYRRAYKNIMDLVQEGNIGLMQAVKRYDPYRGVKLSSYAAWWIRAYILRFILNNWRLVKLGTTQAQRKLFFNLRQKRAELTARGIDPTNAEIAKQLNVPESDVADMDVRLQQNEKSLDAPVGDAEGRSIARVDMMASGWQGPEALVADEELQSLLRSKLAEFRKTLAGKDKDIAIFDERLAAEDPLTLQELGDRFGISRERVRQPEQPAHRQAARVPPGRDGRRRRTRLNAVAMPGAGTLSIVATPIGNLDDLTARAVETLRSCDRIAAEDTRRTRGLLTHLGIVGKPLEALHAHSTEEDVARLVERLTDGEHVALVTDAGTPAVSDPGSSVVRGAIAAGVRVVPIPGPSAVLAALTASGLASDAGFRFLGFLPRDGVARAEAIARACETPEPVVLFESPNRAAATLADLAAATPGRAACSRASWTKVHEELLRGTCAELAALEREWIGEIAIVLGAHVPGAREAAVDDDALDARIDADLGRGLHAKSIAERLAAWTGRPKREVYERVVARKRREG